MIWTDADREAFVRRGPKLWEAVPETKPAFTQRTRPLDRKIADPSPDDLAAAFGLAVAWLATGNGRDHADVRAYRKADGGRHWGLIGYWPFAIVEDGAGPLAAAFRAAYAAARLEWEEVGDATR